MQTSTSSWGLCARPTLGEGSPAHLSPQPPPQLGQQEGDPGCGDALVHNTLVTPASPPQPPSVLPPVSPHPVPSVLAGWEQGASWWLLGGDRECWSDRLLPPRSRVGKGRRGRQMQHGSSAPPRSRGEDRSQKTWRSEIPQAIILPYLSPPSSSRAFKRATYGAEHSPLAIGTWPALAHDGHRNSASQATATPETGKAPLLLGGPTWMQGAPAVALSPAVGRRRPGDRGTPQAASLTRRSRRSYLRAKSSVRPPGLQVLLLGPATSPSRAFISAPFPPPAQCCAPPSAALPLLRGEEGGQPWAASLSLV